MAANLGLTRLRLAASKAWNFNKDGQHVAPVGPALRDADSQEVDRMESMFEAKSIAIVGYSRSPDRWGYRVARNLTSGGYEGGLYLVNPMLGPQTEGSSRIVPSLLDIETPVDCVYLAVARHRILRLLGEAAEQGVQCAILPGVGFAEHRDGDGAELQEAVADLCTRTGLRVLGPNCFGIYSGRSHINLTPYGDCPDGNIAFISQSGNVAIAVQAQLERMGLGFSNLVGIGNQVNIGAYELLDYFARDNNTVAVGLYLEGMPRGHAIKLMSSVSKCTAMGKAVVIIKGGQTAVGSTAVSSHTASMAGDSGVWRAAMQESGAIYVDAVEEMCDVFALSNIDVRKDSKILILADGGGDAVLASDAVGKAGLDLATLQPHAKAALAELVPADAPVVETFNPLILDTAGGVGDDPMILARCVDAAVASGGVDVVMIAGLTGHYPGNADAEIRMVNALMSVADHSAVAVVVNTPYAFDSRESLAEFRKHGVPVLPSAKRVITAISSILGRTHLDLDQMVSDVRNVEPPASGYNLNVLQITTLLNDHDINLLIKEVFNSAEAIEAFAAWGDQPVALKVSDVEIAHKSDAGGVFLDVRSPEDVQAVMDKLAERFPGRAAIIMPMFPSGLEVLVSVGHDNTFGRYIMLGRGGVTAELEEDFQIIVGPISRESIMQAVSKLRIFPIIRGFRGAEPLDIDALVKLCLRLDDLAMSKPGIQVEMNPVILYPRGYAVADVLVT